MLSAVVSPSNELRVPNLSLNKRMPLASLPSGPTGSPVLVTSVYKCDVSVHMASA